ncbi:MAG: hypothetical protein ACYSRP_07130 [Planctomycetota bacterium]
MTRLFTKYSRYFLLLFFLPYVVLTFGAQDLHEFSHPHHLAPQHEVHHYCEHAPDVHFCAQYDSNDASHDADNCLICQWLKHSPQTVQVNLAGPEAITGDFGARYLYVHLRTFHPDNNPSRAPPAVLS